jgi:NADH:ubiquinone oxidoreductase subunit 5 (subunit L)/multisubunit Na+/H+ antiporter MnhA subunit
MLILAIILAVLGALFVYLSKRYERAFIWAAVIAFIAAAIFFAIWLVAVLDDNNVNTALVLLS